MRPCLLPFLLLNLASASAAEWTELPTPASNTAAIYQEAATERFRHNPLVGLFVRNPRQSWFLTDYAQPQRWMLHELRSVKHWLEFDCARAQMRVLARLYYDGPMGQGRLVASEAAAPGFAPVVPGHEEDAMRLAACAYEQPRHADAGGAQTAGP